jgi:hypothetical protein
MIRDIVKACGIVFTLVSIVSFFAFVSPTSRTDNEIRTNTFEIKQTSAVLENLIMTHDESISSLDISYGECETN